MQFIYYPKCSTCLKALKDLESHQLTFTKRHIVEETPSREEFIKWIEQYGQGIKPFFNTSGQVYRQMELKKKIDNLTIEEAAQLLSSNGMLVKRPLLILENQIIIGYSKELYAKWVSKFSWGF